MVSASQSIPTSPATGKSPWIQRGKIVASIFLALGAIAVITTSLSLAYPGWVATHLCSLTPVLSYTFFGIGVVDMVCMTAFIIYPYRSPQQKEQPPLQSPLPLSHQKLIPQEAPEASIAKIELELDTRTNELKMDYSSCPLRFTNILSPIATALHPIRLHANRVTPRFIASQSPLPAEEPYFWEAVIVHDTWVIDLTTHRDYNRYLYPTEQPSLYRFDQEPLHVQLLSSTTETPCMKYIYSIQINDVQYQRTRLHFTQWPDHGAPPLTEFIALVDYIRNQVPADKKLWVHCLAGVGRTGTLLTALQIAELAAQHTPLTKSWEETLCDLIIAGRKARGPLFVQSNAQVRLLCHYAYTLLAQPT